MTLPASKTVPNQQKILEKKANGRHLCKLIMSFDDQDGNGHNTFSMKYELGIVAHGKWHLQEIGRDPKVIARYFPGYEKYQKWHLVSSKGPLHYLANTTHCAKQGHLQRARSCAVWSDADISQLKSEHALTARLPALMEEFKADMEKLGFIY